MTGKIEIGKSKIEKRKEEECAAFPVPEPSPREAWAQDGNVHDVAIRIEVDVADGLRRPSLYPPWRRRAGVKTGCYSGFCGWEEKLAKAKSR